jgi:hypothetical protein
MHRNTCRGDRATYTPEDGMPRHIVLRDRERTCIHLSTSPDGNRFDEVSGPNEIPKFVVDDRKMIELVRGVSGLLPDLNIREKSTC